MLERSFKIKGCQKSKIKLQGKKKKKNNCIKKYIIALQ